MADWASRFIDLAHVVAGWSKDPSTKVGAVITDDHNRIISLGFNGVPMSCREPNTREQKLYRTLHAEQNAMAFAECDLRGARIFITHAPCAQCAAMVVQRGLSLVCYDVRSTETAFFERWKDSHQEAMCMLYEAGVTVLPYTGDDKHATL